MEVEAAAFAQIMARYRDVLDGKRVVVFESADAGRNSPRFESTFMAELKKIDWLNFRIVDSSKVLDFSDYYYLDAHPKPGGHQKLAAAFAGVIEQWEKEKPVIGVP